MTSVLNYFVALPKIVFGYYLAIKNRKDLVFEEFRPANAICIQGSFNQLIWNLDNFVFLTVSNSSKIFFDSGDLIFKCEKDKTNFTLKVYTLAGVKEFATKIRVLSFEQKELNHKPLPLNNKPLRLKPIKITNHLIGDISPILNQNSKCQIEKTFMDLKGKNLNIKISNKEIIPKLIEISRSKTIEDLECLKHEL